MADPTTTAAASASRQFFGHPRGLATLFMTEFFERFSYYGMRALLYLFLVAAIKGANPGLGLDAKTAGAIYGLYAGAAYLASLPGGWIADRLLGQRRTVFWGGVVIMLGNFLLAVPAGSGVFYLGLAVIVIGTGLLKPNVSAMVGTLYQGQPGARRDAAFSIFYMGINLGSTLAPLIAGTVGEGWNWHAGFFCAGLFMAFGLIQYQLTGHYLGDVGLEPHSSGEPERRKSWKLLGTCVLVLAALILLSVAGVIRINITSLAEYFGSAMVAIAVFFFGYVLLFAGLDGAERRRVGVIAIFFLCASLFWAGYEQAATTLNLFAEDFTNRSLLGSWFPTGVHPATWYQSANPVFIVLFAPAFAWLWISLGVRRLDPSAPIKFGLGLLLLGVSFVVMMLAAQLVVSSGGKVAPTWLLLTYLLQTFGELCLSPVGLSNVTKLAPPRFAGQMMGTWFLGAAVGNLGAGLIGGVIGSSQAAAMPAQFLQMALVGGGAGVLMLLLARPIRKWMGSAALQ